MLVVEKGDQRDIAVLQIRREIRVRLRAEKVDVFSLQKELQKVVA